MKFPGPSENQRLSFLLEREICREAQMWKVNVWKIPTNQSVFPSQRDEVIQWLAKLKYQFNLYPETFALASSLLDRILATVEAHPKYLRCIAVRCFVLAAKTVEKDEKIPVLKVLARDSFCGCSFSEILRMERIILDKLNWDLHTATPLDFLHIFHIIAVSTRPQLLFSLPNLSPSLHLAVLIKQLLHCMACNQLLQFKGSVFALAKVSVKMEKLIPDWLPLTMELLQKAQDRISPRTTASQKCQSEVQQPSTIISQLPVGASTPLLNAKWRKWRWMTSMMESHGSVMKMMRRKWGFCVRH
ncbi:Cyclin-I [Heterocephalus glaber]|uniref:Cyclin-I n=1 Tax=Heterocephalus glaber TaxID=10181 RepID=G5BTM9_HETGA|nr:Cyclin-I [Heterocephalus glaber]